MRKCKIGDELRLIEVEDGKIITDMKIKINHVYDSIRVKYQCIVSNDIDEKAYIEDRYHSEFIADGWKLNGATYDELTDGEKTKAYEILYSGEIENRHKTLLELAISAFKPMVVHSNEKGYGIFKDIDQPEFFKSYGIQWYEVWDAINIELANEEETKLTIEFDTDVEGKNDTYECEPVDNTNTRESNIKELRKLDLIVPVVQQTPRERFYEILCGLIDENDSNIEKIKKETCDLILRSDSAIDNEEDSIKLNSLLNSASRLVIENGVLKKLLLTQEHPTEAN